MFVDNNEINQFIEGEDIKVKKAEAIFDLSYTPAIIIHNPKFPHNVGAAVRACSCFDAKVIIFSGDRVSLEGNGKGYRLPREERMRGYNKVKLINDQYPFNRFEAGITPVAVELRRNAESLPNFVHPENPVYVFGPEDGSLPQIYLKHCQRFLVIPSPHCLNLAAAIYVVLYDRVSKILRGEYGNKKEDNSIK